MNVTLQDYLSQSFDCSCGKRHAVALNTVEIAPKALENVVEIMGRDGYRKPFIVSDFNTHKVAGQQLLAQLEKADMDYVSFQFDNQELVPDELALGRLMMNYHPSCDLIIAVGTGTINDMSRYLSHRLRLPYYVVATAPSMDGYASTVAPLVRNKLKTTFECQMPKAIIADVEVIAQAPQTMIAAGFSDVIGKYTALADWRLSALINGEYYCDTVVQIMEQSLERTIALREGLVKGDQQAISELMEALVMAGIAMSYAGNSRPASGSEHHLSHFWEMRLLLEGKPAILHGTKVGLATIIIAKLYRRLADEGLTPEAILQTSYPDGSSWEQEIRSAYLAAAPEVLLLEEQSQKNGYVGWQTRVKAIANSWPAIQEVLESLPDPNTLAGLIEGVGGATVPEQLNLTPDLVTKGIRYAKEVRPRYTILQLLWDLNLLSTFASNVTE